MENCNRLLVVDDDQRILEIYSGLLEAHGYHVQTASTGLAGLEAARAEQPDLVLLDVNLPDLSGIEICRRIKEDPALAATMVALISGEAVRTNEKVAGLEAGADDYLLKSHDWDENLARVRTLLRLHDTTAALRASEQRYRELVELLPEGVSIVGLDGHLRVVNSQAVAMLGYDSAEELLSKRAFDLTPPEEHPRVAEQISAALEHGILRDVESTVLRRNGERFPIELSLATLRDKGGRQSGLVCVWRDVSQRRRVEAELRDSEERTRQIAENIREVFWMTNVAKTEMIYISPAYERIWGRTCRSLFESPRDWLESIHPEDRDRVLAAALTQQEGGIYHEIYRIVRPDGAIRWIEDRAFPVRNEKNEVYRVVGVADDITERRLVEQSLRESEARKGAVMQAALDGIITFDHTGRMVEVNFAAEKMFGYPSKALIGREIAAVLLSPAWQAWFNRGLSTSFTSDEGPILDSRSEIVAWRMHQVEFPVEISITRIDLPGAPLFTAFFRDITRRRRTESRLATLVRAIETTSETIYMTDKRDRITFVNRAFQQIYGFPEAEIVGKAAGTLFAPEVAASVRSDIRRGTQAGGWRGDVWHCRKDGTRLRVYLSTSQIKDRSGGLIGCTYVAQDVSVLRAVEERVRLLADAVRSTGDIIYITDGRRQIVFVNQAFRAAYGYEDEEILGKSPDQLYASDAPRGTPGRILRMTIAGGWRGEVMHVRKNGGKFPVSLTSSPIKDAGGAVINLVFVARDITDRRRTERALAEGQRLQRALLDNISDPVWLKDREGRFLAGNQPLARLLGLPLEEIVGKSAAELESMQATALSAGEDKISRSHARVLTEAEITDAQGRLLWMEIIRSPIFNTQGRVSGTVGIARNITERKQVEDVLRQLPHRIIEAQEAERLRVARELHDSVNQLIASVKMRIHNVGEKVGPRDPAAREILSRCEKMLVQSIEENRRIAHDLRPIDLEELGLAACCRNFCNDLRSRTRLKVECRVPRHGRRLPPAMALNLFRILQESVHNVEKHSNAKTLRIRLRIQPKLVTLRIEDDGRGFRPDAMEPLQRRRRGLGLNNMQQRVASMGGVLSVLSVKKRGTIVAVTIPLGKSA